jgi:hypothetical protein
MLETMYRELLHSVLDQIQRLAVLGIRIRKFLGLPNLDPSVRGTDPDQNPSLSHKGVERTEILLQNKILTHNFSKK